MRSWPRGSRFSSALMLYVFKRFGEIKVTYFDYKRKSLVITLSIRSATLCAGEACLLPWDLAFSI